MPKVNFVLLYVADPAASAKFYADLLGSKPEAMSPTFAAVPLRDGLTLGLWARDRIEPNGPKLAHAGELSCDVPDLAALRLTHEDWRKRGIKIEQPPMRMPFGDTFVANDPDGHRIRVVAPAAP